MAIYNPTTKLRVFIDADVLFAGAASGSEHGASLVVLRLAEITLIEAITFEQVLTEVERNIKAKLPHILPEYRLLADRCLNVVSNPTISELKPYMGRADAKDLPILIAAHQEKCPWLITFNVRHFQPGLADITVLQPGLFIQRVRHLLAQL